MHRPLMAGLLQLVHRGRNWVGPKPAQAAPRCTECNSPLINASVPITVLLCNDPLLCRFNVPVKGLNEFVEPMVKEHVLVFCHHNLPRVF